MYTITELTDVSGTEFDSLFLASLPAMDGGTFSWAMVGNPQTDEEKREAIRTRYQELIDSSQETRCVLWEKDGTPIHIAVGAVNSDDPSYITWILAIYGPDSNGSKSWLYDENYIQSTKDYFVTNWGVDGYKINCINNSSIYNYHMNKPNANTYYDVTLDKVYTVSGGEELATIKYTYR